LNKPKATKIFVVCSQCKRKVIHFEINWFNTVTPVCIQCIADGELEHLQQELDNDKSSTM
jgi:hypothetical protein